MKKSLVLVGLLVASSSVFGAEKDWFVGMEIGHSTMDYSYTYSGYTTRSGTEDTSGGHQAIKLGKYFGNNIRASLSLFRYNEEADVDVNTQTLGIDYLIGDGAFKPFIGVGISRFTYKETGFGSGYSKDSIELKDTALGIQFGGLYEINKNWDIEAGYRILKTNGSDTVTYTPTNPDLKIAIESDDSKQWFIGVNYNF